MRFYRTFGNTHVVRYLLVRFPLRQKTEHFNLAIGKLMGGAEAVDAHFNVIFAGLTPVCLAGRIVCILTERKKKTLTLTDFGNTPANYPKDGARKERALALGMIGKRRS